MLAYVAGLFLAGELGWAVGMGAAVLVWGIAATGAAAVSYWRRDTTVLLVVACAGIGLVRMAAVVRERVEAQTLLSQISPYAPRVVEGKVVTAEQDERTERTALTLADATISSGTEHFHVPGLLPLSISGGSITPWGALPAELLEESADTEETSGGAAMAGRMDTVPAHIAEDDVALRYAPGSRVRALATISEPASFWNFHLPDQRDVAARRGEYAVARVNSAKLVEVIEPGSSVFSRFRAAVLRARRASSDAFYKYMTPREARMMDYLFFNDLTRVNERDVRTFRDSGTMQLFAVSGTHIALLAGLIIVVLRAAHLRPRSAWAAATALLFPYIWLLNFNPPATRAWLVLAAFTFGRWLKREVDPISAFTFAVAVIILFDPLALWQAGFELSLAGVGAILVFVPLAREWIWRERNDVRAVRLRWRGAIARFAVDALVVSISVPVVLLPIQLRFTQSFNLFSPLANAVLALIAGPMLAVGILLSVGAKIASFAAPVIGSAASAIMWLARVIAEFAAGQRWAIVRVPQVPAPVVFAYLTIIFGGWYFVRRDTPEFRAKSMARAAIHVSAAMLLLLATALVQWGIFRFGKQPLRVWFLDVGQGDSTLVQFPSGQSLLVDSGNITPDLGKLVTDPELRAVGVWPLDNLLATHADADHVGGMPFLLRNHAVRRMIEGTDHSPDNLLMKTIERASGAAGVERVNVSAPVDRSTPDAVTHLDAQTTLEILNPLPGTPASVKNNNQSVVLRITHGGVRILLMADAEQPVEERLVREGIGTCDVLKVGHHGSKTSSSAAFLEAVKPAVAVISCGRQNRYGHPHPTVVRRLEDMHIPVYRTDRQGAVLLESDGERYSITTVR